MKKNPSVLAGDPLARLRTTNNTHLTFTFPQLFFSFSFFLLEYHDQSFLATEFRMNVSRYQPASKGTTRTYSTTGKVFGKEICTAQSVTEGKHTTVPIHVHDETDGLGTIDFFFFEKHDLFPCSTKRTTPHSTTQSFEHKGRGGKVNDRLAINSLTRVRPDLQGPVRSHCLCIHIHITLYCTVLYCIPTMYLCIYV